MNEKLEDFKAKYNRKAVVLSGGFVRKDNELMLLQEMCDRSGLQRTADEFNLNVYFLFEPGFHGLRDLREENQVPFSELLNDYLAFGLAPEIVAPIIKKATEEIEKGNNPELKPIEKMVLAFNEGESTLWDKVNELVARVNVLTKIGQPKPILVITIPASFSKAKEAEVVNSPISDMLRKDYFVVMKNSEVVKDLTFDLLQPKDISKEDFARTAADIQKFADYLNTQQQNRK